MTVSRWPSDDDRDVELDDDPVYAPSTADPYAAPSIEEVYGDDIDGMTLDEVGHELGIGREGARIVIRKALYRFARAALAAGLIDRMPRFHGRPRRHIVTRSIARFVAEPREQDDDDEGYEFGGMRRPWVSFLGSSSDRDVCRSVWGMLEKRRYRSDEGSR